MAYEEGIMMKAISLLVILFSNVLIGCQSNVIYVVKRPVPIEPRIVVIPASDYLSEVEYANKIEQLLFKYNLSISSRPSKKYILRGAKASLLATL